MATTTFEGESADPDYLLERVELSDSESDDIDYDPLPLPSDDSDLGSSSSDEDNLGAGEEDQGTLGGAEDFEKLLRRAERGREKREKRVAPVPPPRGELRRRPEVVDDFVRNFLVRAGLARTLETFQAEWFELVQRGGPGASVAGGTGVPDVYVQNQVLVEQVLDLERELSRARDVAARARQTWSKFRKERDFHQMHHKRVAQEKGKLVTELQRLKKHYASYQPLLDETRGKYERAMKDKMLMKLRAEQLETKVSQLEATIRQLEASRIPGHDDPAPVKKGAKPSGTASNNNGAKTTGGGGSKSRKSNSGTHSSANTAHALDFTPVVAGPISDARDARDVSSFSLSKTIRAHDLPCSHVAVHPTKPLVATAGDDGCWKLITVPDGDVVLTGQGHTDWLSSCAFNTSGTHMATGSGDHTVRVWDLSKAQCVRVLKDHAAAVWGVAYAGVAGEVLASASMDRTCRVWDAARGVCVSTMRGHVDSVNNVAWMPGTSAGDGPASQAYALVTVSGDKTVSLWDARSGLCVQTFYGHANAVTGLAVAPSGAHVVTGDADGVVKVWDMRAGAERTTIHAGPHPANDVCLDATGNTVAVCSDSGVVKLYGLDSGETLGALSGHEEAVQGAAFDPRGRFLVTAGSDGTVRYWS